MHSEKISNCISRYNKEIDAACLSLVRNSTNLEDKFALSVLLH